MLKDLPLDLLSTFVAFADAPNISNAAHKLGLSQPAVSIQLRRLEEKLPRPLFVFQGKKKVLSHYGKSVYLAVKERLRDIDLSVERVNLLYSEPERLKLKVGLRPEILSLGGAKVLFPGKIRFYSLSHQEIVDQLSRNQIDVGITYIKPDDSNLLAKELFSQWADLCVSKSLLGDRKLNLDLAKDREFLTKTPCLAYKEENPPYLTEWAKHCGIDPKDLNIHVVCEDWYAIVRMVETGVGYSIAPSGVVPFAKNISWIEIPEAVIPKRTFYLLYPKALRNVPGIKDFLELAGKARA